MMPHTKTKYFNICPDGLVAHKNIRIYLAICLLRSNKIHYSESRCRLRKHSQHHTTGKTEAYAIDIKYYNAFSIPSSLFASTLFIHHNPKSWQCNLIASTDIFYVFRILLLFFFLFFFFCTKWAAHWPPGGGWGYVNAGRSMNDNGSGNPFVFPAKEKKLSIIVMGVVHVHTRPKTRTGVWQ